MLPDNIINPDEYVMFSMKEKKGYTGVFCLCGATLYVKNYNLSNGLNHIQCPNCHHIVGLETNKHSYFRGDS